jgi:hypothetical protein
MVIHYFRTKPKSYPNPRLLGSTHGSGFALLQLNIYLFLVSDIFTSLNIFAIAQDVTPYEAPIYSAMGSPLSFADFLPYRTVKECDVMGSLRQRSLGKFGRSNVLAHSIKTF